MKKFTPLLLLFIAVISSIFVFMSDNSLDILRSVEKSLNAQKIKNEKLDNQVRELKNKVMSLSSDDRMLEKEARNQLGLAKPNELIFLFNDEPNLLQDSKHE